MAARAVALLGAADRWRAADRRRASRDPAGLLAILPVFGLSMLPLGLALIADDMPWLKCRLEQAARWCERVWASLRRGARARAGTAPPPALPDFSGNALARRRDLVV
jgi:hypothetical protein